MNSNSVTPCGLNRFMIRIDSMNNDDIQGVVDGLALKEPMQFTSFMNLVFKLDNVLDDLDIESAAKNCHIRKFEKNFKPNISLEILFRQNHSWQGKIVLLDLGKELIFKSVLELMLYVCTMQEDLIELEKDTDIKDLKEDVKVAV